MSEVSSNMNKIMLNLSLVYNGWKVSLVEEIMTISNEDVCDGESCFVLVFEVEKFLKSNNWSSLTTKKSLPSKLYTGILRWATLEVIICSCLLWHMPSNGIAASYTKSISSF